MIIKIKLFASLRHHVPDSHRRLQGDEWDVPEGSTVAEIIRLLNLPEEEAKIILVNGRGVNLYRRLEEGDALHVFPPIMGG